MGFWIFMTMADLLLPVSMIAFGKYFMAGGPDEVNGVFGYRTAMSMKNRETWEFAHRYAGRIWFVCGVIMTPLTAAGMAAVVGKSYEIIGTAGGIICAIQLVPLIGVILPVEWALRKHFDRNGIRRASDDFTKTS